MKAASGVHPSIRSHLPFVDGQGGVVELVKIGGRPGERMALDGTLRADKHHVDVGVGLAERGLQIGASTDEHGHHPEDGTAQVVDRVFPVAVEFVDDRLDPYGEDSHWKVVVLVHG